MRISYFRPLVISLLLVFISSSVSVRDSFSAEQKIFLWKVKSKTAAAYVLGSIHFMKKDSYPLKQEIEDAFDKSSVLAVEADINDVSKINMQEVMHKAFYLGDDSLQKHVSAETYELVKREFEKLGFPIGIVSKQRPWFLALSYVSLGLVKQGYDPSYGLDMHFLSEANGKKTVKELENLDYQINLLSGFSDVEQEAFLLYSLKDTGSLSDVDRAVDAWRSGDEDRMEAIITESAGGDVNIAAIYEKLLYERNRRMASKIEDYLRTGEVHFVVVGAGHLVGPKGIISLLKNRGYSVEQL